MGEKLIEVDVGESWVRLVNNLKHLIDRLCSGVVGEWIMTSSLQKLCLLGIKTDFQNAKHSYLDAY